MLPATCSLSDGVVTPTPTFPLASTVNSEVPVEDATLNGLRGEEVELCTLRANDDDDALTPNTVPLSIRVEVPTVEADSQRVAYPKAPPVTPTAVIARDEVATHLVDVPIDWRIIPWVPVELVPSKRAPERVRLVVEELVIRAKVA